MNRLSEQELRELRAQADMYIEIARKARLERQQLRDAGRSARTEEVYGFCWRRFAAWCESKGREPLPASADTLALYVKSLLKNGKCASAEQAICAIGHYHHAKEQPSPDKKPARQAIREARRRERNETAQLKRKSQRNADPFAGRNPMQGVL